MDDLREKLEPLLPALRRYARALLCDAPSADELLRDCLQRAIRRWRQRRSAADARVGVFTILHHLALSHLRERARRGLDVEPDVDGWVRPAPGAAARPQASAQRALLSGLAALPDEERSVLLLVSVEGWSYAEAAQVLALPIGTLMIRLAQARDRLLHVAGRPSPRLRAHGAASIAEADVHAFVDGALAPTHHAELQAALRSDPELARRVESYAEQRQTLREALEPISREALPPELELDRLLAARPAPRRSRPSAPAQPAESEEAPVEPRGHGGERASRVADVQRRLSALTLRQLLGAAVLLSVGAAAGWGLRAATTAGEGIAALAREAADSYLVYAPDRERPVELAAADRGTFVQWVSARLGRRMVVPDLAASGYRFTGGRLVPTAEGPAALFVYDGERDTRLMLFARPLQGERDVPVSDHSERRVSAFVWASDGVGFSLVGTLPRRLLEPLAQQLRAQLGAS